LVDDYWEQAWDSFPNSRDLLADTDRLGLFDLRGPRHPRHSYIYFVGISLTIPRYVLTEELSWKTSSNFTIVVITDVFETTATAAFDLELIWRVWGYLPDWRRFADHGSNNLDLLLAVITTIIQIPQIKNSSAYPWLTIFQLLRFYRVILAVPTMRPLLVRFNIAN